MLKKFFIFLNPFSYPSDFRLARILTFIFIVLANQYLTGKSGLLDTIIYILTFVCFLVFWGIQVVELWRYAAGAKSRAPYKQMAYILLFIYLIFPVSFFLLLLLRLFDTLL